MPLPDEGLIHAWLDEQLPPDEAARVEQLVATDEAWAAAAAEARGLIAASSRIVSALDHVPAGVLPKRTATPASRRLPWWSKVAAALVLTAGATTLVLQRTPAPVIATAPATERAPEATATQPTATQPTATQPTATQPPATQPPAALSVPAPAPSRASGEARRQSVAADAPTRMAAKDALRNSTAADSSMPQRVVNAAPSPVQALASGAGVAGAPALAAPARARADSTASTAALALDARRADADLARRDLSRVAAQRPAAEAGVAKSSAIEAASARPVPGAVGGVAREAPINAVARPGACYQLHDSRTLADVGGVMKTGRVDGDTLRLEPVRVPSPMRAWVVLRDGTARGVLTLEPEARGMVLVTATPVACPSP